MAKEAIPRERMSDADRNWRRFVLFRVLFNSRFYYPVLAVLFLDLGLTATQYTLLNFAWAIAIVFTDLPAGVLADRIGRKPLVVAAAIFMVLEMAMLAVAPLNGGVLLLCCCLANRILSGMAEGMASGADEALVFDSLAERGRSDEWPKVLDQVMRWQGVGMVIAMLVGGAIYDPHSMQAAAHFVGLDFNFTQGETLRFPIYLNLITAVITLWIAIGLKEPSVRETHVAPDEKETGNTEITAWHIVTRAGTWILKTPLALFVIIAGVSIDSVVRLFLTFSSVYFRVIEVPGVLFGLIGASLGGIGMIVSPLARRMVKINSVALNYSIIAAIVIVSLVGVAFRWTYWGVIFMVPLGGAMMALGYMVSYYLNAIVDSSHRATILSFKGLIFNLGYGFISLVFPLVLHHVKNSDATHDSFSEGLAYLPLWLVLTGLVCVVSFWKFHRQLSAKV